jgi:hypothetical protein
LDRRHDTSPDYTLNLQVTGVRVGPDGPDADVWWKIYVDDCDDPEYVVGILERVIEVLEDPESEDWQPHHA